MKFYLIFLAIFINEATSNVLPDNIKPCMKKDPQLDQCILSAIENLKPYLIKGIPEIGLESYEPLVIPKLSLDRTLKGLKVKGVLNNIEVSGASAFQIKNLKVDVDNLKAELDVYVPSLQMKAHYDVNGKLLMLPLAGRGQMEGNFTDCSSHSKGSAKIIEKKGIKYLQLDEVDSKINVGGGHVNFNDQDGGIHSFLANTVANFFNKNPTTVLHIVNPIVEDTVDEIAKTYINRILAVVPLSELIAEE